MDKTDNIMMKLHTVLCEHGQTVSGIVAKFTIFICQIRIGGQY